jgi:hypothetical protein
MPRARAAEPATINVYVTPYYDSSGPVIKVGKYSSGLAERSSERFVATVKQMKAQWKSLTFPELYAAAIQLYDRGYRNEATYWFYTAQYQGRLFAMLADPKKLGTMGSPAFELSHAQEAFFSLSGPDINGYAFGNIGLVSAIVKRVQNENRSVGDMHAIYPGIAFVSPARWPGINAELSAGLGKLASQLSGEKDQIEQERSQNGTQARYGKLTSTAFPGGY